jgi:hypothetical protein
MMLKYCLLILMPNENQEQAVLEKYGPHKDSNDNGLRLTGLTGVKESAAGSYGVSACC